MIDIYIDGASIGNPGKAGVGYLLYKSKKIIKKDSIYLGIQTNNFAEYMSLIFALIEALTHGHKKCRVFTDSQLLSEQINGNYKVKNKNILPLFVLAKKIINSFEEFSIAYIAREENKEADKLAKAATGFLI